jgi:hypothetical protein
MKRVVVLAMLAGCSDPGGTCAQNRAHVTWDGTCEFPPSAITIDGDLSDWDSLLAYPPDCLDCKPGEVAGMYATITTNGEVAVYAKTIDAPLLDARHSYYVELLPLIEPLYGLGFRVTPSGAEALVGYNIAVTGIPVRSAIGATGVELAVPISALSFTSGTQAYGELDSFEFGSWGYEQLVTPHLAPACWDPQAELCRPHY